MNEKIKNTGKDYEQFVANLHQAILNAETFAAQKNIEIQVNKIILDNFGIQRQFDIYWEYEVAGLTYKTAIECKDYSSKISIEKIDALIGKTKDIPDLKVVFATKKGYQSGAKIKAEKNKIDLLIVREQDESDWIADDGMPLLKRISMQFHFQIPARINKFEPNFDIDWIKENTDIDISKPLEISGVNNEIFIENATRKEKISLHELENSLSSFKEKKIRCI